MARSSADTRPTVRSEGGLLPHDLLDRIANPREQELPGLDPVANYGLQANVRITEAAAQSWERAKAYWGALQARLEAARPGTELGITRQNWLIPLLEELGYGELDYRQQPESINGREFRISHRASGEPNAPPLHLVAVTQPLDKSDPDSPGPKASPHGYLQSYLNETDHLWGIVSNGRQLRILRDNASLTRPAYLEFDLQGMMEGGVFADFTLLWMTAHRSRLSRSSSDASSCFLEQWYEAALVRGARALGDLRLGVEQAIRSLGQGFLDHPANTQLLERLSQGELDSPGYYRQLLRMVYRLLFLLVAEERDLLSSTDREDESAEDKAVRRRGRLVYADSYAVSRLRSQIRRVRGDERHDDLWRAQCVAFSMLRDGNAGLGLPALGGGIFDPGMCPDLEDALVRNEALKGAVRGLSIAPTKAGYRRINYRDLDVEELGSVYESLLDEQPSLRTEGGHTQFTLTAGGERKSSGSYYTPSSLVKELIRSALDPVIADAMASASDPAGKRQALLSLAVCDPACGSGHFLLEAGRRIGRELARLASGENEPDPAVLRHSIREAITHCVYGVDVNPLAVDLCRLALWIESLEPGRPLGFLDHHIKLGNSLIGATAELVEKGIPTEAFAAVDGDDKKVAATARKQNKTELEKPQLTMFGLKDLLRIGPSSDEAGRSREIAEHEELDPEDVSRKAADYREFIRTLDDKKRAADLWVAAFFWPMDEGSPPPLTQSVLLNHRAGHAIELGAGERQLSRLLEEIRPFHWELEFPEVFADKGGFDCMLGNPPWERVKLQQEEFFATRDPEIANAKNAAARKKMIAALGETNPPLAVEWMRASAQAANESAFFRLSGRFPFGGVGDVNTYAVFADLFRQSIRDSGASALLLPNGLVTGFTYRAFLRHLLETQTLGSFFGFENEDKIFPDVHNETKFGILTMMGSKRRVSSPQFTAHIRQPEQIRDPSRRYTLTAEQIEAINPNTLNLPAFRWAADAEVTAAIHQAAPVLVRRHDDENIDNTWGVRFMRMFDMANDSNLFIDHSEIAPRVRTRSGARALLEDGSEFYPLYEGKMFWHFDHRYGTYEGQTDKQANKGVLPHVDDANHDDASYRIQPRYWVEGKHVQAALTTIPDQDWLVAWRDVGPLERTLIATVLPITAANHKAPLLFTDQTITCAASLIAAFSSLVVDYDARQKSGGMSFFVIEQLAVPSPDDFTRHSVWLGEITHSWFAARVLELIYTSVEIEPFARALGFAGTPFRWNPRRRELIQAELDAAMLHIYGLSREQAEWLIDSFTVLRKYEERDHGEFRTKRLVLEIYDAMAEAKRTSKPYSTKLDPPPADPGCCHSAEAKLESRGQAKPVR